MSNWIVQSLLITGDSWNLSFLRLTLTQNFWSLIVFLSVSLSCRLHLALSAFTIMLSVFGLRKWSNVTGLIAYFWQSKSPAVDRVLANISTSSSHVINASKVIPNIDWSIGTCSRLSINDIFTSTVQCPVSSSSCFYDFHQSIDTSSAPGVSDGATSHSHSGLFLLLIILLSTVVPLFYVRSSRMIFDRWRLAAALFTLCTCLLLVWRILVELNE
jgi:hypothetical protein